MLSTARQAGFTLLEILVVVMLVGLLTAVIASQGNWTLSDDGIQEDADRLRDTLELLNERSLFSGQLLALQLQGDGWTPLAYDRNERAFLAIEDSSLRARTLSPGQSLEWQVDALDEEEVSLSDVAESLVKEDMMATPEELSTSTEESGKNESSSTEADKDLPQVFFFPSGEVTPVTVTLLSDEQPDVFQRWQISALGQVTDPDAPAEQDEEEASIFEEEP